MNHETENDLGAISIIRDFYSYPESFTRTIRVFTPDAYDRDPGQRFPVLYMHDGQNVFSHPESALYHTWCANTTMERLVSEGALNPWIIVGVDHGPFRFVEYLPWNDLHFGVHGRGEAYAEFLSNHLKPFIDGTYRTLTDSKETTTMGASLGGLISLYLGLTRPHIFGRIGAVSPSVMWCEARLFREWREHSRQWSKIYIDAGENERVNWAGNDMDYASGVSSFYDHLRGLGYADWELRLFLEPGGIHHEIDWQRRFPDICRWLLT
jgi:predicted alpha/beta superfamily hydrolase